MFGRLEKNKNDNPEIIPWQAELQFKNKLTISEAKFIFEQAEKMLNDSVASSETIVGRMNTLITLITGSLLALMGYIISKWSKPFVFDHGMLTAIVGICYLFLLAVFSFVNNQPKDYLLPGSLPKDLFNPSFFDPSIPNDGRILRYYVNEIENYQPKIEANSAINERRWKMYSRITFFLLMLPVILWLCFLIS